MCLWTTILPRWYYKLCIWDLLWWRICFVCPPLPNYFLFSSPLSHRPSSFSPSPLFSLINRLQGFWATDKVCLGSICTTATFGMGTDEYPSGSFYDPPFDGILVFFYSSLLLFSPPLASPSPPSPKFKISF